MRILVTGAAGFVGRHLVNELRQAGHEVQATSLSGRDATTPLDVTDADAVAEAVSRLGPDAVVHLAAQASVPASWSDPRLTFEVNLFGASNVMDALVGTSIRLLLVGTALQYRVSDSALSENDPLAPASPYALSKAAAEELGLLQHQRNSLQVMFARSFNHTGPGQGPVYSVGAFCAQIVGIELERQTPLMKVGYLGAVRDLLDVRDVARAYRLIIEKGTTGRVYNVASGSGVRIEELLNLLLDSSGLRGKVKVVPAPEPREGDPPMLVGDPSRLREELGWLPEISLDSSLGDTLNWYRSTRNTTDRG